MKTFVDPNQIPERLEVIKQKFRLSNRQLALHGKTDGTTIGNLLSAKIQKPRLEVLYNIADSLGISREWLAYGQGSIDNIENNNVETVNKSLDSGAFGQEVIDRVIKELKEQYEARISEMKENIGDLKETIGDLREQLKFNRELIDNFKEGQLGKSEGATIRGLLAEFVEFQKNVAA